jgi:hypothetical protein
MCKREGCQKPENKGRRGFCHACYKKDYRERFPEKEELAKKRWFAKIKGDPEWLAKRRAYRKANQDKGVLDRRYNLRRRGISSEDFLTELLTRQGGVCAVCKGAILSTKGRTPYSGVVDHCHKTGKIRGLLHRTCNSGLGFFGDSPEHLEGAAAYLRAARRDGDIIQDELL